MKIIVKTKSERVEMIKRLGMFFIPLFLIISCANNDDNVNDELTINSHANIDNIEATFTTINVNATVTPGEEEIITQGICWSLNPNPTIDDSITIETEDTFTGVASNLFPDTDYYFRVYVTTSTETIYGAELLFSTRSLNNTHWNLYYYDEQINEWQSSFSFHSDGSTSYYNPASQNEVLASGTWETSHTIISYDIDALDAVDPTVLLGNLSENTITGILTDNSLQSWIAIEK